jgi:hypothetical protein
MTGLDPSRAGGFPIEVKAAAPTQAAVSGPGAFEGRFGRPGKRALFCSKDGAFGDDLVHREQAGETFLQVRRRADDSLNIRRCMFLPHDRIQMPAPAARSKRALLLTTCESAAENARGQETPAKMMWTSG